MNLNLKAYTNKNNKPTVPYTYSVTHKKSGIHYYGSRYCRGCSPEDLFKTYFTSCKIIHDLIKSDGVGGFRIKIRKIFKDDKSCIEHENRFLKRVDAKNNTKFFNRQNETIITHSGFKLITNGSILIRWPKEKPNPEGFIDGIGKKKESFTKGRKWIHNPVTKESRMIKPDEQIPEGYSPNRPPEFFIEHSKKLKNKDLMYINNGIDNRFINKNESIPEGWNKGRLLSNTKNLGKRSYKYITITDGKTNTHLEIGKPIPEGWRRGKTFNQHKPIKKRSYKWILITNGLINKQLKIDEPIPEGWIKGEKPRKKLGKRSYECIVITDGTKNRYLRVGIDIPEGWRRGKTVRKN